MVAALTDLDDKLKSLCVVDRGTYDYLSVDEVENLAEVLAVINGGLVSKRPKVVGRCVR
ncbi:hypothetical protein [Brevibacterium sp. HMSC24B04]|uniref:hypothetical protein n=1 Tax=Brevibacterium sp. HMSC24B04 TaxID=1581060 RepID=UPI00159F66F7|nr:hypothetical protein [Brevibacterium sp. HMSC24B04]